MEIDGGNYTCHNRSNGQYLNHTLIMIQLKRGSRTVILEKKFPKGKSYRMTEIRVKRTVIISHNVTDIRALDL